MSSSKKVKPIIAIPALLDILSSILMLVALNRVAASVFQMMRGMVVVMVACLARIIFKRK
jgi:hypothetical protein